MYWIQFSESFSWKLRVLVLSLTAVLFANTLSANVLTGEPLQKEAKKVAKTLKDEGWKDVNHKSIKEALDAHYHALGQNGNLMPIEGRAKASDLNLAIRKAQNSAARQYASMMGTTVEGTTQTQITHSSGEESSEEIKLSANYQSTTSQTVKSLKPTVVFYRTMSNGWVEVRAFYLVKTL